MDSNFVPQAPALPITSFTDMASNADRRLNALNSDNMVQCETDDKDMADRIVGAIKGGFAGALPGVLGGAAVAAAVATGPVGWTMGWAVGLYVGAPATIFGAVMGAGRGFIRKGN